MKTWTTTEFRNYCLTKYPALITSEVYRIIFRYLCFSTAISKYSPYRLMFDAATLCLEIEGRYWHNNFNLDKYTKCFKQDVIPNLVLTDYEYTEGIAREVECIGFDNDMMTRLATELKIGFNGKHPKCFFISGQVLNKPNRKKIVDEKYTTHTKNEIKSGERNTTQQMILDYLDKREGVLFSRKLIENAQLIENAMSQLSIENQNVFRKRLDAIALAPKPLYHTTKTGQTVRIFDNGYSPCSLIKDVRRALCHGWTEVDLVAAQFSILATLLDSPKAKLLLHEGENIWQSLYACTHPQNAGQNPPAEIKGVFKKVIYSIAYGKSLLHGPNSKSKEEDITTILTNANLLSVLNHPIIKELFERRKIWYTKIKNDGFAIDAFGNKHLVTNDRKPHQIGSTLAQSYELVIFSTIYEDAIKHGEKDQYQIVLHLHDGAVLSMADKKQVEKIKARLSKAVDIKASSFKIKIELEFKDL